MPDRITVQLVGKPSRDPEMFKYVVHSESFAAGVFNANAARTAKPNASGVSVQRLGYLDQRMFGYALACYTRMRNNPAPKWQSFLSLPPSEYMNKGVAYLQKAAPYGGFPTQKQNT